MKFSDLGTILNRENKRLIAAFTLSAIGNGMTLSLLMVYLHDQRGFSNTFGGFVIAFGNICSLLSAGPLGALIDRIGPKKVTIVSALLTGLGAMSWTMVTTKTEALLAMALFSVANPGLWAGNTVMLTRLTAPEHRQKIYGLNFMGLNLGLGCGGLIAALIIQENSLLSFQLLYTLDGITYLLYFLLIFSVPTHLVDHRDQPQEHRLGSYRELFAIKELRYFLIGALCLMTFGYGELQAGIPVFTTQYLELSPKWLGVIFGANTLSIVAFQPLLLRMIERISKYRALIAAGVIWSFSWIVMAISPLFGWVLALIAVALSQVIFAFGEMIWSPTAPAILNEISPDHLRGRANALNALLWGISGVLGPSMAGLMLGNEFAMQWVAVMAIGSLVPLPLFYRLQRHR